MTFSETLSPAPCEEDVKVACDLVGCRIARAHSGTAFAQSDAIAYAYNAKSELTNAVAVADAAYTYSYDFDEIGNRRTSSECGVRSAEYASNELNQYTAISTDTSALFVSPRETFTPLFDADGNQTRVKTATGIWQVTYNGENRPILWTCGDTNIEMSYDRMGRRVTKNDQRFVYDGYLQIANHHSTPTPSPYTYFIWDPTEPVATRPLVWFNSALDTPHTALYYAHDGNKNVSEVVASDGTVTAHYEYAPFGAVTTQRGTVAAVNPWRFSSEFADDELGCDYYNYREYEPVTGRWMNRDPIEEDGFINLYVSCANRMNDCADILGENYCVCVRQCIAQTTIQFLRAIAIIDSTIGIIDGFMELPYGVKRVNLGVESVTSLGNVVSQRLKNLEFNCPILEKHIKSVADWARTSGTMSNLPGIRSQNMVARRMAKGLRNSLRVARGGLVAAVLSAWFIETYCASACICPEAQEYYESFGDL